MRTTEQEMQIITDTGLDLNGMECATSNTRGAISITVQTHVGRITGYLDGPYEVLSKLYWACSSNPKVVLFSIV